MLKRLGLVFQLVLFALTGPGMGGLEQLAHAAGLVDLAHERSPHVEPTGGAHADHCQLGLTALDGRLPSGVTNILRADPARSDPAPRATCLAQATGRRASVLARAPPT
jgi:hypothetical protein